MLAGASAVALGTVNFTDPRAPLSVLEGLQNYARRYDFAKIADIVGLAHTKT
jgi:dihydroorotate dehydrogenase (NAD+) catalytic subunit